MADRSKARRAASRSAVAILSLAASLAVAGCSSTVGFDDPFADYLQRTALVSTTGGNAQAANIAMQTATPWPRYSNDTNIPANGARIAKAITRYESGSASSSGGDSATPSAANPGGNAGARTNERRLHRNVDFSSRPTLRQLERRRLLSMTESVRAKKPVSLWRDEDGSALVEATIVMPLLLTFFSACSSSPGFFTISSWSCRVCETQRAT